MGNGIKSLGQYGIPGYQEGNLVEDPEDEPGWLRRWGRRSSQPLQPGFPLQLPLALRQITADVLGKQVRERLGMERLGNLIGSRDITAGDLSRREYEALQDAVLRGMEGTLQDSSFLEYADYATEREGEDQYSDVGGSGGSGILTKFLDPSFSMKSTLGQANVVRGDPERGEDPNDYYVIDQYNFNERLPESTEFGRNPEWNEDLLTHEEGRRPGFLDILGARSAEQGAYGVPRAFGQAYGSPEGEGSLVRINLGNLEEALARSGREEQPSRLARGLGWLRGIFDRDDDVQVVERVAPPVDELRDIQPVRGPRLYDVSPTDPLR